MTRLDSRIDSVTVHRRGAIVTRVAELPEGAAARVSFGPLPLGIADGSVRVAVHAPGDLEATGLRVVIDAPEPDEDLPPARPEDLLAATREVARLRAERDAINRDQRRIETLGVIARPPRPAGQEPSPTPADARLALLRLRETRQKALDERARENARAQREAERHLADLNEREARASTMRRTEPDELQKRVDVTLRGSRGEGPASIHLEYRTDAARWAPNYSLRLDSDAAQGALEVRAVVAQRSGEDWDGVVLTLSTATLSAWAELRELASLRIGRQQRRPRKSGWRPPPVGTDALFADFDRAREEPPVSATAVFVANDVTPIDSPALTASPMYLAEPFQGGLQEHAEAAAVRDDEQPETGRMRARGGPPPPPMSMPASDGAHPVASQAAPAPARRAMAKGAPVVGAVNDVMALLEGFGAAGAHGASLAQAVERAPLEESVDAAMLDYGRLRMLGPTDDTRGKLVLRSVRALYLEHVHEMKIEVDLGAALGTIERRTSILHAAALPAGCVPPSPSGFDYAYRATGRLDVASDGVFHNLALWREAGDARLRYVVVPRESRDAFRFVEMDNPLDAPLLDGPIDVYVGGDFLLTSNVREVPEGGVLRLGLGVEQRVKVSRNARFTEKSGGLMGGRLDLDHEIEIDLENLLPGDARIEVRERVPTLREEEDDIRLEEHDVSPPWEAWEPDEQPELEGGRRWNVRVPAGGKAELRAGYTIRIASKHELVGGNRRES